MQDNDSSVLKWAAGAVGVILVCFLIGYYVLGPSARGGKGSPQVAVVDGSATGGATIVERAGQPTPKPAVAIIDRTAQIEEQKQKAVDEAKKKADAEAAKKKADDEAKRLAAEQAALNASPSPSPSPDPDDLPPVEPSPSPSPSDNGEPGEPGGDNSPKPDATPIPPTPRPVPTPSLVAPPTASSSGGGLYRVRVGSYADRSNAESVAAELNGRGYQTSLVARESGGKTVYRVQVGAYKDEKSARDLLKELKGNGYDAVISHSE